MSSKTKKPLGPVIHWGNQPASGPTGMKSEQRQVQQLSIAERLSDSFTTAIPSSRTHDGLKTAGCFRARRQPGAE